MSSLRIGALTIGQSPRPDLVAPLHAHLPHATVIQAGALDGLTAADLPDPTAARYPLHTRLADGTPVTAGEGFLTPHLQTAIHTLEAQAVHAIVLLCAGTFADLHSRVPFYNPTTLVGRLLHSAGVRHIGVVSPFATQRPAAETKWRTAGFDPVVWTAPPTNPAADLAYHIAAHPHLTAVVLDYVGHTPAAIHTAQAATHLPLFDLGHTTFVALSATQHVS